MYTYFTIIQNYIFDYIFIWEFYLFVWFYIFVYCLLNSNWRNPFDTSLRVIPSSNKISDLLCIGENLNLSFIFEMYFCQIYILNWLLKNFCTLNVITVYSSLFLLNKLIDNLIDALMFMTRWFYLAPFKILLFCNFSQFNYNLYWHSFSS